MHSFDAAKFHCENLGRVQSGLEFGSHFAISTSNHIPVIFALHPRFLQCESVPPIQNLWSCLSGSLVLLKKEFRAGS